MTITACAVKHNKWKTYQFPLWQMHLDKQFNDAAFFRQQWFDDKASNGFSYNHCIILLTNTIPFSGPKEGKPNRDVCVLKPQGRKAQQGRLCFFIRGWMALSTTNHIKYKLFIILVLAAETCVKIPSNLCLKDKRDAFLCGFFLFLRKNSIIGRIERNIVIIIHIKHDIVLLNRCAWQF